ncbi:hypothetical protein DFH27DRAFT_607922 [Peziza echinospora]|nr:hypothetical protein DFH27DRAFT_607922 [Peziza echinospora]
MAKDNKSQKTASTPSADRIIEPEGVKKRPMELQKSTARNDKLRLKKEAIPAASGNEASLAEGQQATKALLCAFFPGKCRLLPPQPGDETAQSRKNLSVIRADALAHLQLIQCKRCWARFSKTHGKKRHEGATVDKKGKKYQRPAYCARGDKKRGGARITPTEQRTLNMVVKADCRAAIRYAYLGEWVPWFEKELRERLLEYYDIVDTKENPMSLAEIFTDHEKLEYALSIEPMITLEWPTFKDKTGETLEAELNNEDSQPASPSSVCFTPMSGADAHTTEECEEDDEEQVPDEFVLEYPPYGGASDTAGADFSTAQLFESASEGNISTSSTFTPTGESSGGGYRQSMATYEHDQGYHQIPSTFGNMNLAHEGYPYLTAAPHQTMPIPNTINPQCIDPSLTLLSEPMDFSSEDGMCTPEGDYDEQAGQSPYWG